MSRFQIVVCAENSAYLAWQAMLFHYSCARHLAHTPIVVVHKGDEPLLPEFERMIARGGVVQTAPNYRTLGGVHYPPGNTAATLRHVRTDADAIVLCDPDMIFLQPIDFGVALPHDCAITFDQVGYLEPAHPDSRSVLLDVCPKVGVSLEHLRDGRTNGGVPHVIPRRWQRELGDEWLRLQKFFPVLPSAPGEPAAPRRVWLTAMWTLVLAAHRIGLEPRLTHWCLSQYDGTRPRPALTPGGASLIHYCYADAGFDKRRFVSETAAKEVWNVPPDDGTVSGAIRGQVREAREFYFGADS
ncbi:MAG: hypothetical protein HYX68_06740 [Planctomycetes bacterium]|nr:hypothetical protein [Planctomycetota bacterium]